MYHNSLIAVNRHLTPFQMLASTNVAAMNGLLHIFGWTYVVGRYTQVKLLAQSISRLAIVNTTNHLCKVIALI